MLDVISVDVDHERADQELAAAITHGVPHARLSEIPTTLLPWLLPVEWSRERLWAIERLPVQLSVVALRWLYDLPLWRAYDGRWFMVTPSEFLLDPAAYAEHERGWRGGSLTSSPRLVAPRPLVSHRWSPPPRQGRSCGMVHHTGGCGRSEGSGIVHRAGGELRSTEVPSDSYILGNEIPLPSVLSAV